MTMFSLARAPVLGWAGQAIHRANARYLALFLFFLGLVMLAMTSYFTGALGFVLPSRLWAWWLPGHAVLTVTMAVWAWRRRDITVLGYLVCMAVLLGGLFGFLHDSGGHTNPLISVLLIPVAMAAGALPWRATALLAVVAIAAYAALTQSFVPLHRASVDTEVNLVYLHLLGMWLTFVLSVVMLVSLVAPLATTVRQQREIISTQREQMLRGEQMVAMATFAAGAAHQLATPLATITVLADELAETEADAERQADLQTIATQASGCKLTLQSMLARADGAGRVVRQTMTVTAWLDRVAADFRLLWPTRELRVTVDVAADVVLRKDDTLDQALLNLLDNAARASGNDLHLQAERDGDLLRVQVIDQGQGLSAEVMQQLGQPFVRGRADGSGLGLFLSNAALAAHGGTLHLASTDHGTVAEMRLPLVRVQP